MSKLWPRGAGLVGPTSDGRERRGLATRRALLSAGRRLFVARGLGVTVDDIVVAAKTAKGSFYNHFASKEELFEEILRHTLGALNEIVVAEVAGIGDPVEALVVGLHCSTRLLLEDEPACRH